MKIIRGIYLGLVYVMALPLAVVFMAGMIVWSAISAVRYHCADSFKDICDAMLTGLKEGHEQNMKFVKEGRAGRHF